jgi:hyperosmotically inducible periplasmic protein
MREQHDATCSFGYDYIAGQHDPADGNRQLVACSGKVLGIHVHAAARQRALLPETFRVRARSVPSCIRVAYAGSFAQPVYAGRVKNVWGLPAVVILTRRRPMTAKLAAALLAMGLAAPAAYGAGNTNANTTPANPTSATERTKDFVEDSVITAKVKAEFAKDKDVSAMNIKVVTDKNGVVTLSGTAKKEAEARRAVAIARNTKGVSSVNNEIKVAGAR